MMEVLREDPGSTGLATSVSGMITKHGMGLWSTTPATKGFLVADVSEQSLAQTPTAVADASYEGPADVVAYTVTYEGDLPQTGIAIARAAQAGAPVHTIVVATDPGLLADLVSSEWIGRRISVTGDGFTG
jgi:acetyl-CoA C-acetyltransferase